MRDPDPKRTGARDSADTGVSFGDDAPLSNKSRAPIQAILETEAEALAFGYGLPPADHLTACRALWLRLRLLGVPLPAEPRVILIEGGSNAGE